MCLRSLCTLKVTTADPESACEAPELRQECEHILVFRWFLITSYITSNISTLALCLGFKSSAKKKIHLSLPSLLFLFHPCLSDRTFQRGDVGWDRRLIRKEKSGLVKADTTQCFARFNPFNMLALLGLLEPCLLEIIGDTVTAGRQRPCSNSRSAPLLQSYWYGVATEVAGRQAEAQCGTEA